MDFRLSSPPSRRTFLAGLATAAAGTLLSRAHAQPPALRLIDCHHHFTSPAYIKTLAAKEGHYTAGYTPYFNLRVLKSWAPDKDLELMDQDGVTTAMLSCTTPGIWFGDPDETASIARDMNEFAARLISDHKGRFGLFALLPMPNLDLSLKEISYALDTLKADGIGLMTSYGNHWIGDPIFRPVFDELNRRKAVVYTHPIDAPCCQGIMKGVNPVTIEYNTDTARTIYSLISSDAAARYSDIRFLFSHAGGTMTALIERFGVGGPDVINENLSKPAQPGSRLDHLRRFYYDTAQSTNVVQMHGLKTIVGTSQIVFGTDFPFVTAGKTLAGLKTCGFSEPELRAIESQNAMRLLSRKS
jgi:6-methylsalicylate decarboxylase